MRGLGSGHVTCGPMRGLEKNCIGRGQVHRQTKGHRDSMTESAQWADSVKIIRYTVVGVGVIVGKVGMVGITMLTMTY